jgi:hypothetical protein
MSLRPIALALSLLLTVAACAGGPAPTQPTASPTDQPTASPTGPPPASPSSIAPSVSPSASASSSPTASDSPAPSATPAPDGYAWTQLTVGDGPSAREDHTFTLGGDGQSAYLFGGRRGPTAYDDLWRYDLATDTWQQLSPEGDVPAGRFGHVAAWVDGIGLVVWSGQAGPNAFFSDIWAYDPDGFSWTRLPDGGDVPLARYGSCGAIGPDGRLWISHGFTADEGRFFDTRAYDFATGTWADLTPTDGDVPVPRCLHDCLWTPDGQLVLYGGQTTGLPALGDLWTWLTEPAGHWTQQPQPAAPARQLYALAELGGRAFIFGGGGVSGGLLGDLWLLDLASLAMVEATTSGDQPSARSAATFFADPARHRLLLFGGKGNNAELDDLWQLSPVAP